ncbi:MAG: hypothetical protein JW862_17195 [Anaerolineales bacterium]|nr:hypothetical protein [Anaerolineales bacterium]
MADQQAIEQAKQAIQLGNHPQALSILRGLLKQQPRHLQAWLLLSEVVEQPEHAIQCLERVLQLDSDNAEARQKLARLQTPPPSAPPAVPPASRQAAQPTIMPERTATPEVETPPTTVNPAPPARRPSRPAEGAAAHQPVTPARSDRPDGRQPVKSRRQPAQPPPKKVANRTLEYVLLGLLAVVVCCVLGAAIAALGNSNLQGLEPTADPGDPRDALYENIRASNAEDQQAYMATIHPDSPSYTITANSIGEAFATHDLSYQLSNVEIISQDSRKAVVSFTLTTTRLRGPAFRDNRITGEMTMRLHDGQWKIYSQEVNEIEYLD